MEEVTVKELQELVDAWHQKRKEIQAIKDIEKDLNQERMALEFRLIDTMEALELDRFEGTLGKVTKKEESYITTPKGDDKAQFFEFLKSTGEFDLLATVDNRSLNSWFKNKCQEEGALFMAPGLGEVKTRVTLIKGK